MVKGQQLVVFKFPGLECPTVIDESQWSVFVLDFILLYDLFRYLCFVVLF